MSVSIVPPLTISSKLFGTKKGTVFDKWGNGMCAVGTGGRDTCVWSASTTTNFPEEAAVLELSRGKVCGMELRAGSNIVDDSLTITKRHHVTTLVDGGSSPSTKKKVEEIQIFKQGCAVT